MFVVSVMDFIRTALIPVAIMRWTRYGCYMDFGDFKLGYLSAQSQFVIYLAALGSLHGFHMADILGALLFFQSACFYGMVAFIALLFCFVWGS